MIHQYTLVEKDRTVNLTANLNIPDLLATCRQIREESLQIWYVKNYFSIRIHDCDISLLLAFDKHLHRLNSGLAKKICHE